MIRVSESRRPCTRTRRKKKKKKALSNTTLVSYILNKGSIEGPLFKTPFIGPFLQSMDPKFEEYYAKWVSGPLSCVSVFHKYVPPDRVRLSPFPIILTLFAL